MRLRIFVFVYTLFLCRMFRSEERLMKDRRRDEKFHVFLLYVLILCCWRCEERSCEDEKELKKNTV